MQTNLLNSWSFDQISLIRALILRDFRLKHGSGGLGILSEFLRPMVVIAAHWVMYVVLKRHMPANIPVELFLIGGFTTYFALSHSSRAKIHSKRSEIAMAVPMATDMHYRLASVIWELFTMISVCYFGLVIFIYANHTDCSPNIALNLYIFAVAALNGFGFMLVFDAATIILPFFAIVKKIVMWFIFVTGGVFFSMGDIKPILFIMTYNPLLHLIEYQRHALYKGYPILLASWIYPLETATFMLFVGLMMQRSLKRLIAE